MGVLQLGLSLGAHVGRRQSVGGGGNHGHRLLQLSARRASGSLVARRTCGAHEWFGRVGPDPIKNWWAILFIRAGLVN
jgi:hypothetical protein